MKAAHHRVRFSIALLFAVFCASRAASQTLPTQEAERVPGARSPGQWTVMVYLCADNNLEGAGIEDINEMEVVGSTADVAVLAQFDRIPGYDVTNGDWTSTRRYYVNLDTDVYNISSTLIQDLGEVNMGDPASLVSFVQWGVTAYPADHYLLVLWDHGDGWRKAASPLGIKGIAYDETNRVDYLSTREMAQALSEIHTLLGRKLDILACDACLMQMAEVAYEIRDHVAYHVASEEYVPWDGYPYNDFLAPLVANPAMPPSALCQTLVDTYIASYSNGSQGTSYATLSAVDLSQMAPVAAAVDVLGLLLADALSSNCEEILTWWSAAQPYGWDYRDLYHIAQLLYQNITADAIRSAAADLIAAVDAAVISESHVTSWVADSHGLSIYYPPPDYYEPPYGLLAFGADTSWDSFLAAPKPCDGISPDAYEPDDDQDHAATISVGLTQPDHWFHRVYDGDWVRFDGQTGVGYCIGTRNLGPDCDTLAYLYSSDGSTLISWDVDSGPEPLASMIEWLCPISASYYVFVEHYYSPYYFGLRTSYDLFVKQLRFSDVPGAYWAFHYIDACCNAGIVSGYGGGVYRPTYPVTRDQMAVFVSRALAGGDENVPEGPPEPSFPDVPNTGYGPTGTDPFWAYDYIEYVAANNIVGGYDDNTYRPAAQVNRAQMAVFVARSMVAPTTGEEGLIDYTPPETPTFPDVPNTGYGPQGTDPFWAYKHIEYIVSQGVAAGYDDGLYHPERIVTRGQMAVFVTRAFQLPT